MMIGDYWTRVKLERIEAFLPFFIRETSDRVQTIYLDPFAGTGNVELRGRLQRGFFPLLDPFMDGSARRALRLDQPFDEYYFVEKRQDKCQMLKRLGEDFPNLAKRIHVECGDANEFLQGFCNEADWESSRALIFLDPTGMQVSWKTILTIADTKAADLWYLFPLGQAVNRLLKRNGEITKAQKNTLNRLFGDSDWEDEFYRPLKPHGFFPKLNAVVKVASFKIITSYFIRKLKSVFPFVVEKPLALYNRRDNPMFLLCFASADSDGEHRLAIAQDIANIPSTAMQFSYRFQEQLSKRQR